MFVDIRDGLSSGRRYLQIVGAGILLTPAAVVGLFGFLIVVGLVNDDGPSNRLFLAAIVFVAGLYAGFIALRTSVKTGVLVLFLVAGLVIKALFLFVNATTLRWHSCPAVGASDPGCRTMGGSSRPPMGG